VARVFEIVARFLDESPILTVYASGAGFAFLVHIVWHIVSGTVTFLRRRGIPI